VEARRGRAPRTTTAAPIRWREAGLVLGVGGLLAPTLALVPILDYVGWFLTSLVHEIGHCVAAWFFGTPAYPAIRIDGHAAAMHSEQRILLALAVLAGLVYLAWCCRKRPVAAIVAGLAVLLYPALAFTRAHDVLHLLAGHLGELAFGGVFFYRALSGGFTASLPERVVYAGVALFLVAHNLLLDWGLATSMDARHAYAAHGSFGITQDFVRTAHSLGCTLSTVGGFMLLPTLATLPIAWFVWRLHEAHPARPSARHDA